MAMMSIGIAILAQDKVADYFYPVDSTIVNIARIKGIDGKDGEMRAMARVELPDSTVTKYNLTLSNEMLGIHFVCDNLEITDSLLTVGICYAEDKFSKLSNKAGHFYNVEVLRLPPADGKAEWEAVYWMGGELYAKKYKMTLERVVLKLTIGGVETEVPALRLEGKMSDRFGNRMEFGDFVEFWAKGRGMILRYSSEGKLMEYSADVSNPPLMLDELQAKSCCKSGCCCKADR